MRWPRRWWTRTLAGVAVAALVASLTVAVDGLVLRARIDRLDVALDGGTTWLLVGSDSRSAVPGPTAAFGSPDDVPGARADALIAVRTGPRAGALSIPRDLLVSPEPGVEQRAALLLDQPTALVTGLCRTLGLGVGHLVVLDMAAFAAAVDVVGGVPVDLPAAVRDTGSGLALGAGRQELDGATALALVRSRHPETLVDGDWRAVDDASGTAARTTAIATVFSALAERAGDASRSPWTLHRLAWAVTGGLAVDRGTGVTDLVDLARTPTGTASELPTVAVPGAVDGIGAEADATTRAAVDAAGLGGCSAS